MHFLVVSLHIFVVVYFDLVLFLFLIEDMLYLLWSFCFFPVILPLSVVIFCFFVVVCVTGISLQLFIDSFGHFASFRGCLVV